MKEHICRCLAELELRQWMDGFVRQAAVLMPIFEQNGSWHLLLTRRTDEVETHKGQISFPGGMREPGETLEQTALRETFEEVGIPADRIEILGQFHDYISITNVCVTPFAARLHAPFPIKPQVHEVAEVLQVPLQTFFNPDFMRVEKGWFQGKTVNEYYYAYGAHTIWGLTARIIHDFLEVVHNPEQ